MFLILSIQILSPQIEPLSEQQFLGVYNLQLSSQQAEDALTQGMESLQQTLAETVACSSFSSPDCNIETYMSQMALAMGKIATLESFVRQVSNMIFVLGM
jgi:transcription factor TGA